MAKIIATKTKGSEYKVRKQLEGAQMTIKVLGLPDTTMTAAKALLWGRELLRDRRYAESNQVATQLVQRFPAIIDTHLLYLQGLVRQDDLLAANQHVAELLTSASQNSGVLTQAGQISLAVGDAERALNLLKRAYKIESTQEANAGLGVLLIIASCYSRIGDKKKAASISKKILARVEASKSLKREMYLPALLEALQHSQLSDQQLAILQEELLNKKNDVFLRSTIAFGFANQRKDAKDIDDEIRYLDNANSLLREGLQFNDSVEAFEARTAKQTEFNIKTFPAATIPCFTDYYPVANVECQPISIIGMPRSGTTLLEQMLGSHSAVGQVGESKGLSIAINRAYAKHHFACALEDYPSRIEAFPLTTQQEMSDTYWTFQKLLTDKPIFVEKELSSFRFVGITANLFPQAKFIHMNRAPLDIFLSCFRGSITGIKPTCSVPHMAIYYLYMKKLIGHWKSIYPDRVYVLDYAELVEDPETHVRDLVKFLGIEWEDSILKFHERKNVVRTLSVNQVRKGIYTSSVNKWTPYKKLLQPAIDIFESRNIDINGVKYL